MSSSHKVHVGRLIYFSGAHVSGRLTFEESPIQNTGCPHLTSTSSLRLLARDKDIPSLETGRWASVGSQETLLTFSSSGNNANIT